MARLADKVAIVTGAAAGIGAATARLFAREGARVVLFDIDADNGARVAADIRDAGGDAVYARTDVRDEESIRRSVALTLERHGKIDSLVNVAGGSATTDAPVHEVDMDLWDKTHGLDLKGTFLCCRHVVPAMIATKSGTIVNTSSWAALSAFHKHVYVTAKGGVVALTKSLAGEYARYGIRANVVCPGGIRTERSIQRYGDNPGAAPAASPVQEENRQRNRQFYPYFGGEPIDIANINLFLASDESRMITGSTIEANGGRSAY